MPPLFDQCASKLYANMGQPVLSSKTFWQTYQELLHLFLNSADELVPILTTYHDTITNLADKAEEMELLPNMKPFRNGENVVGPKGYKYIGGLINPPTNGLCGDLDLLNEGELSGLEDDAIGASGPEYASDEEDDDNN